MSVNRYVQLTFYNFTWLLSIRICKTFASVLSLWDYDTPVSHTLTNPMHYNFHVCQFHRFVKTTLFEDFCSLFSYLQFHILLLWITCSWDFFHSLGRVFIMTAFDIKIIFQSQIVMLKFKCAMSPLRLMCWDTCPPAGGIVWGSYEIFRV